MGIVIAYWCLQTFNVVFGLTNLALAGFNIYLGAYWWALFSFAMSVLLARSMVTSLRNYRHFKREERELGEQIEREMTVLNAQWWRASIGSRAALELACCLEQKLCPDCAERSLDVGPPVVCGSPTCGSRFNVDANGKWSRL